MAYAPIAAIIPQYDEQTGYYLKFYIPNTTTPISMATDSTGATLLAKCQLDNDGFPTTDGTQLFIPHVNQAYDAYLFPSAALADANDTTNARRIAQNSNVNTKGTQGNPYEFDTCYDFVNNLPYDYLKNGDFIRVNGRTVLNDGMGATYQVTNTSPNFRRNYENYIPVNGDGADAGVTLWAVLKDGFKRDFKAQPIEIIAHRGFNDLGVQNTISNYSAASKYPCDAFETDWQITSDGFGVLYHDLTLDEDTSGTGAIKNNTFDYVRNLTFSELGTGFWADKIRISKVEDFFEVAARFNKRVYIEIKDYRQIEDIQLLLDVIVLYDWESMTNISSFRVDDVVEVRNRNKKISVGWLTTNLNSSQEDIDFDKLQKLKLADVLIVDQIMIQFPAVQQKAYDAGVGVAAWGIQYEKDIQETLAVNVPRLIVDNPNHPLLTRGQQNVTY